MGTQNPKVVLDTPLQVDVMQLREKKILVVGTVRNCELTLERNIDRFRTLLRIFDKISFFIVESDSNDNTALVLKKLSKKYGSLKYISLGQLEDVYPSRTDRIAICRNYYLNEIRESREGIEADYIFVVDLDSDFSFLTPQGILSCWKRKDWDACFANQNGPYYDIWALRHPTWSPTDCWNQEKLLIAHGMNRIRARQLAVYSKMVTINKDAPWIQVQSAFGGLAIYKRNSIVSGNYVGKNQQGLEVCEHVSLNTSIHGNGGKLFINPAMITGRWNVHNAPMQTREKMKRYLKIVLLDMKRIKL